MEVKASQGRWTGKQFMVLAGIWFAFLISFITRLSWSTIMPTAIDQLHFTVQQGSSYLTAFYIGYAITVLPGGMLADKFGYRKLLLAAVMGNLVVMAAMVFMHGSWLLGRISITVYFRPSEWPRPVGMFGNYY